MIDIGWNDFKITTLKRGSAPGFGGYDSFTSFSKAQKEEFKKWYMTTYGSTKAGYEMGKETLFSAPRGYDDRLDHLIVFFNGIR